MAATTPLDIANMALGILTEAPIDSLDEDTTAARMMRLHYETTREAELSKRAWTFAIKRSTVQSAEQDDREWRYAYEMPEDALRALPVLYFGREIDWMQQGSQILTRAGGDQRIVYVANLIDPNDWPSYFTEVLVAALAIKVAHPITGKSTMVQVATTAYDRAVREAARLNAFSKRGRAPSHSWEAARAGRYCA